MNGGGLAGMHFTKRELQVAFGLWVMITIGAGVAGPFGTHGALAWPARLAYWALVSGASIGLFLVLDRVDTRLGRWPKGATAAFWRARGGDAVYALLLGGGIWALNRALFPGWGGVSAYAWLVGIIALVTMMIGAGVWLLRGPATATAAKATPGAGLLRHLPVERRAPLVRIEAQDHYLLVVTRAGQSTILMRMLDAEALLPPDLGARVHRSHWVAFDAVRGRRRMGARTFVETLDGAVVPVSRAHRKAAQAAGLI